MAKLYDSSLVGDGNFFTIFRSAKTKFKTDDKQEVVLLVSTAFLPLFFSFQKLPDS